MADHTQTPPTPTQTPPTPTQTPPVAHAQAGRKEWTGLCVLLLPLLLVSMDVSVLYFAVPFISRALAPSSTQQLWIFDVYGFVLAGLLITMGSLGDRIGRRRLLLIGAVAFSLASLGAAYSHTAGQLIGARAVEGIAGATLMPSTLALIRNMFHDEKQRRTAIAIWTAATMSGIALGPVLSGILLNHFWWGSVFLINVPFMIMLLALGPVLVPEFRAPQPGRFDLLSSVLSLGAVLSVIYGIKEIAAYGLDGARILWIVAGAITAVAFVLRQARCSAPMIDLKLFRSRGFTGSILMSLVSMFALIGFAVFTTQYLESVLGMRPFTAALWSMVPMAGTMVAAPVTRALAQRVDRAYVATGGFLVGGAGFAGLTQVHVHSPIWVVLAAASVYAGGVLAVMSIGSELIMSAVPPERAGAAAAGRAAGRPGHPRRRADRGQPASRAHRRRPARRRPRRVHPRPGCRRPRVRRHHDPGRRPHGRVPARHQGRIASRRGRAAGRWPAGEGGCLTNDARLSLRSCRRRVADETAG